MALVTLVAEEIDAMAGELAGRLEVVEAELGDVRKRLERHYEALETSELALEVLSPRILSLRHREEQFEAARDEAERQLEQRRVELPNTEEIKEYVADFREFLQEGTFPERKALIRNFVEGIEVNGDEAVLTYTIPISQSTPKTELLLGGRSEEFRVGNEAEASSHLVWDVEGGLHPEEQPRVGLWLSEQFLLPADVFLQSFSSTPTVRPRQHVAIGLGNAVRELAVPAQVSGLW